jgi:hypothetical protein
MMMEEEVRCRSTCAISSWRYTRRRLDASCGPDSEALDASRRSGQLGVRVSPVTQPRHRRTQVFDIVEQLWASFRLRDSDGLRPGGSKPATGGR